MSRGAFVSVRSRIPFAMDTQGLGSPAVTTPRQSALRVSRDPNEMDSSMHT